MQAWQLLGLEVDWRQLGPSGQAQARVRLPPTLEADKLGLEVLWLAPHFCSSAQMIGQYQESYSDWFHKNAIVTKNKYRNSPNMTRGLNVIFKNPNKRRKSHAFRIDTSWP